MGKNKVSYYFDADISLLIDLLNSKFHDKMVVKVYNDRTLVKIVYGSPHGYIAMRSYFYGEFKNYSDRRNLSGLIRYNFLMPFSVFCLFGIIFFKISHSGSWMVAVLATYLAIVIFQFPLRFYSLLNSHEEEKLLEKIEGVIRKVERPLGGVSGGSSG